MPGKKVELLIQPAGINCKLVIDGKEVTNCRSVTVHARVGEVTSVMLELINVEVVVDGSIADVIVVDGAIPHTGDVTTLTDSNRSHIGVKA